MCQGVYFSTELYKCKVRSSRCMTLSEEQSTLSNDYHLSKIIVSLCYYIHLWAFIRKWWSWLLVLQVSNLKTFYKSVVVAEKVWGTACQEWSILDWLLMRKQNANNQTYPYHDQRNVTKCKIQLTYVLESVQKSTKVKCMIPKAPIEIKSPFLFNSQLWNL